MPPHLNSHSARVLLTAIAGQETEWSARSQTGGGDARGFWQIKPAAVATLMNIAHAKPILHAACETLSIHADASTIHSVMVWNDVLATVVARLWLWICPSRLPLPLNESAVKQEAAWRVYLRAWQPGHPVPERWPAAYQGSVACHNQV